MNKLKELRSIINRLDVTLLFLLNVRKNKLMKSEDVLVMEARIIKVRMDAAALVGQEKLRLDLPIYQPNREEEKFKRLELIAKDRNMSLSSEEIRKYFQALFNESRVIQESQKVNINKP